MLSRASPSEEAPLVVRVGKALSEDRTFMLLGSKRGNLYQIPNIVFRWDGEACAVPQIACLTTTLDRGKRERGDVYYWWEKKWR